MNPIETFFYDIIFMLFGFSGVINTIYIVNRIKYYLILKVGGLCLLMALPFMFLYFLVKRILTKIGVFDSYN